MMIPQLSLVTSPSAEPVSVAAMLTQLGMGTLTDQSLSAQLHAQLFGPTVAARSKVEQLGKFVCMEQTWLAAYDHFPRSSREYDRRGRPSIRLPLPPLMQIDSFKYVDVTGTLQTLPLDTTYGSDPNLPAYAYQLQLGSDSQAARLSPAVHRSWPPTLSGADGAVQITFTCGYAAGDVPANVLHAIKMLAQFYYEHGGSIDMAVPQQILNLLNTPTGAR